jgi:NTE family protein
LKHIGLALGGGVARGAAHVGVLSVLEREGIPIECVAGTSAGSLVGALYCAGLGLAELPEILASFGWRAIASPALSRRGLLSFARMERWLADTIGDVTFAELRRPFAVVATDLVTGRPAVLREGRVAPAVRASCSMPGIVVPIEIDGRALVDGSIANSVPAAAARSLGATFVIGVNLFGSGAPRAEGLFSIGLASLEHMLRYSGGGLEATDCLISPELAGTSYTRFGGRAQAAALGVQATEAQLPAIREALSPERLGC